MCRGLALSLLIVSLPVLHGCGRGEGPPRETSATTTNPGGQTTGNTKVAVDATPVSRSGAKEDPPRDKVDAAKLRELVEMPSVHVYFDFRFRYGERDGRGNLIDPAKEIARLIPKLDGSVKDADIYLDLAGYYQDVKDKAKSQEVMRCAEQLLAPHANTSNPKEARLLLNYVDARRMLEPERWQEREKMLLRVVQLDANDWKGWCHLGTHMLASAQFTVLGGRMPAEDKKNEALEKLMSEPLPAEVLAQVEQRVKYARHCSDQAKKLAPTSEEQWEARIGFLLVELPWSNALAVLRGGKSIPTAGPFSPEAVARGFGGDRSAPGFAAHYIPEQMEELKAAARACPEHIGMQVFGVMTLIPLIEKKMSKDKNVSLSPEENQYVKESLDRLENITRKAKAECATYCRRAETCLRFKLAMILDGPGGVAKVEPHFRALLEGDPTDHDAADVFEFVLDEQKKNAEALDLARKRLALKSTSRNRYLLARSLLRNGKVDEAAKELDAALQIDPKDGHCLAGRAVMWMKEGSKEGLVAAGKLLDRARAGLKPGTAHSPEEDVQFLSALHAALTGQATIARLNLELLRAKHGGHPLYDDALAALGPATTPATLSLTEAPLLPTPPKTPTPSPTPMTPGSGNVPAVFTNPTESSLAPPPVLPPAEKKKSP